MRSYLSRIPHLVFSPLFHAKIDTKDIDERETHELLSIHRCVIIYYHDLIEYIYIYNRYAHMTYMAGINIKKYAL